LVLRCGFSLPLIQIVTGGLLSFRARSEETYQLLALFAFVATDLHTYLPWPPLAA
jgi:hypothetical protein